MSRVRKKRKTYVLQVKVSPDQRELIRLKAESLDVGMATWARKTLMTHVAIVEGELAAESAVATAALARRRSRRKS